MRYNHRQIEEAKMLGRKLLASKKSSVPPLSCLRSATTLFFSVLWLSIRMRSVRYWMLLLDRTACPKCEGRKERLIHVAHDEFALCPCPTCGALGWVDWRQRESLKWGDALKRYRLRVGCPLPMASDIWSYPAEEITNIEEGLVPLDEWPAWLRDMADLQLDRDAAGHVSTT